jgi:hypothetical protein
MNNLYTQFPQLQAQSIEKAEHLVADLDASNPIDHDSVLKVVRAHYT